MCILFCKIVQISSRPEWVNVFWGSDHLLHYFLTKHNYILWGSIINMKKYLFTCSLMTRDVHNSTSWWSLYWGSDSPNTEWKLLSKTVCVHSQYSYGLFSLEHLPCWCNELFNKIKLDFCVWKFICDLFLTQGPLMSFFRSCLCHADSSFVITNFFRWGRSWDVGKS